MNDISIIYLLSGVIGTVLIFLILTRASSKTSTPFVLLLFAASYYSITYGIELSLTSPELILAMIRLEYIGISLVPPLWLLFVINYTRNDRILTAPLYAALFIIPAIVIGVTQSNLIIPLLYENVRFYVADTALLLSFTPGPIYLLSVSYLIIALISGLAMLSGFLGRTHGVIKEQAEILILAGLILILFLLLYLFWIRPLFHIDITPLSYLFTLLIVFIGMYHYRLFSLVPVGYDMVFQTLPSGLIIFDNSGYVIEANDMAGKALHNCDIRENPGKIITEYSHEWPQFSEFMQEMLDKKIKETENDIPFVNGETRTIYHVQTTFLKDRHGNTEGTIVTIRDVTFQKKAEEEIRKSEETFREFFEKSPVSYVSLDEEGRITGVNPEYMVMTGYTEEELLNKKFTEFLPEDKSGKARQTYSGLLKSGKISIESELTTKNGTKITVYVTGRVQNDIKGGYLRTDAVIFDITERKKIEKSLYQANKKLNLLSSITRHDILNQITVLMGYLEISKEHLESLPRADEKSVDYIRRETEATRNIYEHIKFTEDYQDIGIKSPVWQNVGESFKNALKNVNTGTIKTEDNTDSIFIYADPLLEKVFYNLAENSVKYGEKITKISLDYELRDKDLILKYSDDGKGIPDEEKENAFNRKFYKNSGLGMFLSREILAITDISIKETGVFGEGVIFEITVPYSSYRFEKEQS
ncbi:PAS domain S-box-containing protein [Methanomicrobium sp. W14]|uniref:histidine kinase N-terminal 7TM domain-containing protein n=1 Tax=Methanomicrobium sp. W14 TaxID=2817839 RepID=UPI001AE1779C|nr:histidine kinase N-terminal 7TM domain-containing protein [Methanomicrobium sp. W14]MBP2134251.1 PAS domain S-box-containing protein [Methanomicrobium sp. W14]